MIKGQTNKPTYYSILTAEVRYSELLSPMEKIIYSEITALSSATGKCWATNQYFADLFKVEPTTVSEWINNLKRNNFVTITGAESKKRVITMINTLRKKPKVAKEPKEKTEAQPTEKAEHNNTSSNNINNTANSDIFNSEEYLRNTIGGKDKLASITSLFALMKGKVFKSKELANAFIYSGFNLGQAKELKKFSEEDIIKAMKKCNEYIIDGRKTDWSLKAVVRAINK